MAHTCYNCKVGTMHQPPDQHPSYLQCDSCMAIELTYEPMDYQEEMHKVNTGGDIDIISAFGGYGSGKSRSTLQEFLMRALENPNGTGMFAAQTIGQLKKTTLKTWFDEICPPPLIDSYNKSDEIIKLINGFTIYCLPTDNEQKIRSLNIGLAHIEEISGVKKSIYTQTLSRMRDSNVKNKAVIVCSNPANTWIKDEFVDNEARKDPKHPQHDRYNPYIRTFIWRTELNKYLPKNFIDMNTKGRPNWYVQKYFMGDFSYNSGMVYPEIAQTFIDPYPVVSKDTDEFGIPREWERVIGADYGLRNPTAVVFGAINPKTGETVIYDEYYVAEKTLPYHAEQLKRRIDPIPAGLLRFMVMDPATKNRMNDVINGKSIQSHFQEYGLYWQMGNNSIEYGLAKVNSYIEAGKLKIYKTCVNLIKELLGYVYPEVDMDNAEENMDEKPIKQNDHACFVGETLIETKRGQIPIKDIKIGDVVKTRKGFKRVYDSALTGVDKEVYRVTFSNGSVLVGTGNHKIFTENRGKVALANLRYDDIIIPSDKFGRYKICKKKKSSISKMNHTLDTQTTMILEEGIITDVQNEEFYTSTYTEKYIKTNMEKFQKVIMSTISTIIHSITALKTLWQSLKENIHKYMQKKFYMEKFQNINVKFAEKPLKQLNSVTFASAQMRAKHVPGISRVLTMKNESAPYVEKHLSLTNIHQLYTVQKNVLQMIENENIRVNVNVVEKNFQLLHQTNDFAQKHVPADNIVRINDGLKQENALFAKKNIQQEKTVPQKHVPIVVPIKVEKLTTKQDVYNISVEEEHEYFANGILVGNCDGLRYLIARLPDDPHALKAEAHEPPMRWGGVKPIETLDYDDYEQEDLAVLDFLSYY